MQGFWVYQGRVKSFEGHEVRDHGEVWAGDWHRYWRQFTHGRKA